MGRKIDETLAAIVVVVAVAVAAGIGAAVLVYAWRVALG